MSKKRKDRLLLNLLDDKKHRHRVAMVNEESGWNQHEPNSGMARMFVIMLLIHVVVIGGIIIYDFMNGDETATTAATRDQSYPSATANSLPPTNINAAALEKEMPIEEYDTYQWRSGDSLPAVAKNLRVSEEVLIKLNMLDKGAQIDQHTIIRFPRRPVVKALPLNVTPSSNGVSQVAIIADSPPGTIVERETNEAPMNLTPPGETFTFEPTIQNRLTPEPVITPGQVVQDSPPAAKPTKNDTPAASSVAALSNSSSARMQEKTPEQLPEVPKAVPVPRPVIMSAQDEGERAKPTPKKIADAPPAAKSEAVAKSPAKGSYVVKPGDTLYRIAAKNGISVAALQKANNITKPESLRDGLKLVIPVK